MSGVTSDVSAGQSSKSADEVDQQQPGFNLGFANTPIYFDLNQLFLRHVSVLRVFPDIYFRARSFARARARRVSSLTRPFLYSAGPRKSELGSAASEASWDAWAIADSSSFFPRKDSSALLAFTGVAPTLVKPIPAFWHVPPPSMVNCTATPAVAKSPTFLSSFRYAPPLRGGGTGIRISLTISSCWSSVVKRVMKKLSMGNTLSPFGPTATTCAPSANIVAG